MNFRLTVLGENLLHSGFTVAADLAVGECCGLIVPD
jgi:hypothetical protein